MSFSQYSSYILNHSFNSISSVACMVFVFLLCSHSSPAHAGKSGQGPSLTGYEALPSAAPKMPNTVQVYVGQKFDDSFRRRILAGPSLSGVLDDGTHIAIEHFRGDVIVTHEQNMATGSFKQELRHPRELVGFHWDTQVCDQYRACISVRHRIADVSADESRNTMPTQQSNSDVWLYRVERALSQAGDGGNWMNVCRRAGGSVDGGLFVTGQWRADGSRNPAGYTFSCNRGAIAKCVRTFGYKPWKTLRHDTHGQVSLQPLHEACVRAVRADYRGDGVSHTREGVIVDIFDVYGFNVRTPGLGFTAEASFDRHGVVSLHRPRVPADDKSLTRLGSAPGAALLHVWSAPGDY